MRTQKRLITIRARLIRAPHNGSGGPRWGYIDGEPIYPWAAGMAIYGLPYEDVPDIHTYDDLRDEFWPVAWAR